MARNTGNPRNTRHPQGPREPRAERPGDESRSESPECLELLEIGPEDDAQGLLELEEPRRDGATIKVVGVGGGGGNALDTMIESGLSGVEFIAANTDAQALRHNRARNKLQLGTGLTRGLGCGANPDKGRAAAIEDLDRLRELLTGSDMVFVTAGLGGGTGTGGAPVVAQVAREVGALTVAVVTKPFQFEGRPRMRQAEAGLDELHGVVDTLITIPNQRLLALAGRDKAVRDAFRLADEVLFNAVRGISDLITVHGLINLDFADVRTIMNGMGMALMGTGNGTGETRAADAASAAISSPLLEDLSIEGARGVLINITGGPEMTLFEVGEASGLIHDAAHEDANIILGAVIDETLGKDELRVTVIATGLDDERDRRPRPRPLDAPSNVTPLRPEPHAPPADAPPSARRAAPAPAPAEPAGQGAGAGAGVDDFLSPFEDELEVPAFLRRGKNRDPDDEQDVPAFLRRSAD